MPQQFPDKYLLFNDSSVKNISIVVQIEGADLLSNRPLFTRIRYGDKINGNPIKYGDPGIVYGGLRPLDGVRPCLMIDSSSINISQKLEPEQGRGSISTMSMVFADIDGYITQLLSPGVIIPEILGAPVKIWMGYEEIAFSEEFVVIFRGYVSAVQDLSGKTQIEFSDPNLKRKSNTFLSAKTKLAEDITSTDTAMAVLSTVDFHAQILGPDGTYDTGRPWNPDGTYNILANKRTGIRTFLKMGDEYLEYGPLGIAGEGGFTGLIRGARGTTAVDHMLGDDVQAVVEITDHGIDLALKMMLSGFNGPYISDVEISSIGKTFDPFLLTQPNAIILPNRIDAKAEYGLTEGDYITIAGSAAPGNNTTYRIERFANLFDQQNRIIFVFGTLTAEYPTTATLSLRSQFDVYPVTCGNILTPEDVDVQTHLDIKGDFLSDERNSFQFLISSPEACKSFIETELMLPLAAYSLTKQGKLSLGYTKPPISGEKLLFLNETNILDPQNIKPKRGLNLRKFFNEISFEYDYDDNGKATSFLRYVDIESVGLIGVSTSLPIKSRGAKTSLGTNELFERRAQALLQRYKRAATMIDCKVNWEIGCQIESGDVIALQDENDALKIANFETGDRGLGVKLFEVVDRNLNIKDGNAQLSVISGINADVSDRFAVVSPSSLLDIGSTTNYIIIKDSFGVKYPGNESRKWEDYMGQAGRIRSKDFTTDIAISLLSIDRANIYKIYVDGLVSAPAADLILEIPDYPDSPKKIINSIYKQIHCFFSPRVQIVSGSTNTQFTVSLGDIDKFKVNGRARIHTINYSYESIEVIITAVDETLGVVTINTDLGFIVDNTYYASGLSFPDTGGFYRFI